MNFTADIFLEGEYNQDLYDLEVVEEFLKEEALKGFEEEDMITINAVLVTRGAVWQ